ncbi:unnamed protein product [Parajaminaea phylloscopi]
MTSEQTPLLAEQRRRQHGRDGDAAEPAPAASDAAHGHIEVMPPMRTLAPIILSLWVPVFIASLDSTIVATLVGSISSSFNASEQASWVGSSYLLSLCCFNPLLGRMSDVFGRRGTMLASLAFFTVGTLGCGMAKGLGPFLVARIIAGAGGGGLTTTSNIIMSDLIPIRNRGLMQGCTNIIFGLGSGLGGPVGGFLNDLFGWRQAFIVQVPFLALAATLAVIYVKDSRDPQHSNLSLPFASKLRRIDFLGSFTLVTAVACILIPLSLLSGADASFSDPLVYGIFATGALALAAFIYVETSFAAQPILPVKLLLTRTGGGVALSNFTLSVSSFATLYTYPLYFQAVRLETASEAGLHIIPYSVALSVSSVAAGAYMRSAGRFKNYTVVMAFCQLFGSLFLFAMTPDTPEWLTYIGVVPMGIGGAGVLTTTLIAIINVVSRSDIAVSTALTYLFRTSGQVLGVGLSGTILQFSLRSELRKRIPDDPDLVTRIRHSSELISHLPTDLQRKASEAYFVSSRNVWLFLVFVAAATVVGAIAIEDRELPQFKHKDSDDEESDASDANPSSSSRS